MSEARPSGRWSFRRSDEEKHALEYYKAHEPSVPPPPAGPTQGLQMKSTPLTVPMVSLVF